MKTKKIIFFITIILFQFIAFVFITQLSLYTLRSSFFLKTDLAWGTSLFYFNYMCLFLFSISDIIFSISKSKIVKFFNWMLLFIIAVLYWYNSLLIHPYRTALIIISFIVICVLGNFITRKIWRCQLKS
jgi:hypothetical protein